MLKQVLESLRVIRKALEGQDAIDMKMINFEFLNLQEGINRLGMNDIPSKDKRIIAVLLDEIEVKFQYLKLTSWNVDSTREMFLYMDDDDLVRPD